MTTNDLRALRIALMSGVAFASPAIIAPVYAQDEIAAAPSTEQDNGLEEIVVTAQKSETNLQQTPISISVMSAGDLVNRHAQSIEDLGDGSVPSLRVAPFFARNSALTIGMRGIGALGDANQPARDQAVGVYIDGVYLGRAQGLGSALYDVERIEVAKGPQGTLFGRNTEGGAISIVTRAPSGAFHMNTTVGYGEFNSQRAEMHVDFPSFHNINLKMDGLLSKRGGTVKNPTTSGQPDFNSYDKQGFHAEALANLSDDFTADYAFDVSHDGTTPFYAQLVGPGSLPRAPLMPLQPERAETANVGVTLQESVGETHGHRLTLDWQVSPEVELKSISSYRKLTQSQFDNGEQILSVYAPNGAFSRYSMAQVWQHQSSEELQALANFSNFKVVAGGFYYKEYVRDNAQTPNSMQWNATGTAYTALSLDLNTIPFDRASHVNTESYGAFGQVVWTPSVLDERAHLTAGGRYTNDSKKGFLDTVNGAVPSYIDANRVTITGPVPLDASWSHFDPSVNLAFDVTQDVNVYGKWSTGYKAGGANSRSLTYRPFDPETVSMFEVGAKTQFLDNRARFNVAAYTGNLKDLQVDFNVIILNNNRGTVETTNAATGKTKGFEADAAFVPFLGLTLSGSYTYTKVTLSQAFNPFINAQSTVYPLYTPRHAGSIAADYEWPLDGATISAHVDGNFADGQYTSSTDPTLSDKSFVANGRLAVSDVELSDAATLQVALWARNLFNEQHAFLKNFNASLGTYAIFNEPRAYGVEAKVAF